MKLRTTVLLSCVGVFVSTAAAFGVPASPKAAEPALASTPPSRDPSESRARAVSGDTLVIDTRLGHASLARGDDGETFLFAQVAGTDETRPDRAGAAPLSLAVVIDKSGSMKGERIANALSAAVMALERMRDGDVITVVAFDTRAEVVVPATRVSPSARPRIEASIRGVRLGGDTCISCGLEAAMGELERVPDGRDRVQRMVLLSDGATNAGVRDVPGLRALAARMRGRGVSVSTIGVDVDFDEKVMAAIANEANGHHYFVANASGLERVFSEEFDDALASVARDAELAIELGPGVQVAEVFDRPFRREGSRLVVPFGTFGAKEEKTVLVRLRVPTERGGERPVADLSLRYRDLVKQSDASCGGALAVTVLDDGREQRDLDPFVAARLERSRTARTLTEASRLFETGRVEEARSKLQAQTRGLQRVETKALALADAVPTAAPRRSAKSLERDFADQIGAVAEAERAFAAAPPRPVAPSAAGPFAAPAPDREGRAQVRRNQQESSRLGF